MGRCWSNDMWARFAPQNASPFQAESWCWHVQMWAEIEISIEISIDIWDIPGANATGAVTCLVHWKGAVDPVDRASAKLRSRCVHAINTSFSDDANPMSPSPIMSHHVPSCPIMSHHSSCDRLCPVGFSGSVSSPSSGRLESPELQLMDRQAMLASFGIHMACLAWCITLWLCRNSYWKWWFSSWIFPLKMVIFHSYVPEGRIEQRLFMSNMSGGISMAG